MNSDQPDSIAKHLHRWFILGVFVVAIVMGGYLLADWFRVEPADSPRTFVGRQSCIVCHQQEAELFHDSDHDLAMDRATENTVLAKFDGQSIEHYGITSRVFKDGARFMVNTEGPDGQMHDYEVKYVFGVRPLQQYMVELEPPRLRDVGLTAAEPIGRLQVLRLSWDTVKKHWFYLSPPDVNEKLEPDDPLHWTGVTQCWNTSCAECHSTNVEKNFDPLSRTYSTTFSEIDVSCEACHGPGSLHVKLANSNSLFWDRKQGYGLNKMKSTSNIPQVETCAPCHSRRSDIGGAYVGCRFDEHYACQLLERQLYHDDGQIRDEDYVYGSFIQSKMFHNGIRCTDCHDPHSVRVKFTDNQLCTSCHQHPAGKYDTPNHHHHQQGSTGSLCIECHMPATTYMDVDRRRDHSFRVPRPDMSVTYGTPNACTACHADLGKFTTARDGKPIRQYLDWIIARENGDSDVAGELSRVDQQMAAVFDQWYPADTSPGRTKYYEDLTVGKSDRPNSLPTLIDLAKDRTAPAIFRASAMFELVGDPTRQTLEAAIKALRDPDSKVVAAALLRIDLESGRISDRMRYSEKPDPGSFKDLVELVAAQLDHQSRRVRIEAARVFANIPGVARRRYATQQQQQAFESALKEFRQSLAYSNDRAMSFAMLAGIYESQNDNERAMDAYRTAIMVQPNITGPRSNLAAMLDAQAEALQQQLRSQSTSGVAAGQLQSLIQQLNRLAEESARLRKEEHELLKTDLERSKGLPGTHGLHYRFAMSSYMQQDLEATEKHLLEADRLEPGVPAYLLALATFYEQQQQPEIAAKYVYQLIQIDPNHPGYRALAEEIGIKLDARK